ncbi:transglycosylase SLT domain-containing protein [Microvirga terricola]|uniref:Lytic transglycosylase domain-containing protein n=1 Tax=Microvirga terricola TaxID=2719797 RepID=A0ABX0V5D2_9HYPH|nr:transglycosylase SLT domain-containing protein [Microvirga terricola]NIX74999.1 lytic transglycosylase domain-containing protein [Microvirga terricola]
MKAFILAVTSVVSICSSNAAAATNADSCEREMVRAASKHGIPLGMLYAVGLAETGRRGSLQPYAMNIEGRAYFATSVNDAIQRFQEARRAGVKLIDLGCMQINHYYHGDRFGSVASMLSPRENVEYAAQFLKELKAREGSWTMAVARYHAGPNNDPAQKTYVCRVISNMVASGFGEWTPRARSFCQ